MWAGERYAHSGRNDDRSDWQTLADHASGTADLAGWRGQPLGLGATSRLVAAFHDFGKNDPDFERVLLNETIRVDHSTAGGALLMERGPIRAISEMLGQAILGHHAGLPDTRGPDGSLHSRIDRFRGRDPIPAAVTAAAQVDFAPVLPELSAKIRQDKALGGFDLSVAGRMVFSCLVDADFRDTEAYYDRIDQRQRDRDWPALADRLPELRRLYDARMAGFSVTRDLDRLRARVLAHVRGRASESPGLFTLTVPTGGGKTLASLGFALDHAAQHGHRRIIYAIPYTSVIDQTAKIFRDLLGDLVLEHHSAIDEERSDPGGGRAKMRLAMEDWAAPIVVTTNVQLFESLFAARPSRCRKLHNIAGSVIVLDEAQCLPRPLLIPTLRMIETLATHYGCTIVLCTATQPAFDSRQLKAGGLALAGRELAPDPEGLAGELRRARIVQGGEMDDDALVAALADTPQGLVIVNSRRHALELFETAQRAGLEGLIHLTTRQYAAHRRRIIAEVRARLLAEMPCRLIATSLIEAGIDLDFPKGWRAEAGLDSLVQAAGRINREDKLLLEDSTLTVFSAAGRGMPNSMRPLVAAMRQTAGRFEDLLSPEAIRDWFEEVYWKAGPDQMGEAMVAAFTLAQRDSDFPYRTIAEKFHMIEDVMVPVIVAIEAPALAEVERLNVAEIPSGMIARALQPFTVQIPERARRELLDNVHASFRSPDLRGNQFCVLDTVSLYHPESGLRWEAAGELSQEQWMI